MLGSNQRSLPCEVSIIVCWRFLEVAKSLQISTLFVYFFSRVFGIFVWVAAHRVRSTGLELCTLLIPIRQLSEQAGGLKTVDGGITATPHERGAHR